ncbi:MAG TPA: TonB-dependent receptor, partial [Acidobacteriaceae bacterium]
NQFVVNGSQMQVSEFFLDGAEFGQMRTVGSLNESAPPVDAVREFKVTTTLLPADYGHSGPAAGLFSIRSGANQFHGSVYEYFRNNYLDGQPWGVVSKVYTRQNEFGATIGGPIRIPFLYNGHNRSFFFFSYGGSRKSGADSIQNLRVPSAAEASGVFDPKTLFAVYDPATTKLNAAGTGYTRTQFANNTIPANRIDPVAASIVKLLPAPNLPASAGTNDYQAFKGERLLDPDAFTFKLDHQLTTQQHLDGTFVHTHIPRDKIGTGLPGILSSDSHQLTAGTTIRVDHDWVLGPNRLNALVLGFNRFANTETPPNGDFGLNGLPSTALPYFAFTQSYPDIANNGHFFDIENNYQIKDVFNWTVGRHDLRFGGELRRIQFNDTNPDPAFTTLSISDLETQNPASPSKTGDSFASFLLGQVNSATTGTPYEIGTRYKYAGFFMQDDWKVNGRLTLNLGMRWEFQTFPTEVHDHASVLSLTGQNPGAGNLPGALIFAGTGPGLSGQHAFAGNDYSAAGPRFGLTFLATRSTLLRGGYGIFYSDTGQGTASAISSVGFSAQANILTPDSGLHPAFVLSNGFPSVPSLQPVLSPTLLNPVGSSFQGATYLEARADAMPRIQEWTGGIQQTFGKQWLVEVNYIGNHGTRLYDPNAENINQDDPKYLSLGSLLTIQATSSQAAAAGIKLPYPGFVGTVAQALRPYPQYGTLTSQAGKPGYNIFHSMQAVLQKRSSFGLTLGANYTWSKNLGISSPAAYAAAPDNVLQNSLNPSAEYSYLPIDVPQALVLHTIYELPFGQGKHWLGGSGIASKLVGGWKISGVQRYQSGYPIPILAKNSLTIGNRILRPNKVPGVDASTHTSANAFTPLNGSRFLNPAAFTDPLPYTFGNAAPTYGDARNPNVYNEDLSIVKTTQIYERVRWNLYLQAFNALNRHRWTSIDGNIDDAGFGRATVPSNPRFVQLGTRFEF